MKNILKTLLTVFICVCSLFVFVACKDNAGGGNNNSQNGSQSTKEYFLLKETSLSLIIGDEYTLMADYYVEEDGEISFRSSNLSVAEIDGAGKITAIGEGETTITAELGDFSATCAVSVSFGEYVPTILFNAIQSNQVNVADTDILDLTASVYFNGKQFPCEISYLVSNTEIGQVEEGIFMPLQAGETDVTVSGTWKGIDLLPVTVSVKVLNAVEIEVKEKGGEYNVNGIELYTYDQFGGNTLQVSFEVEISVLKNGVVQTEGITVSVEDNDGVVRFDEATNVVTALAAGDATLKVCFTDGAKSYEKTVSIKVNKPTGTYEKSVIVDCSKGELPTDEIFAQFPEDQREIVAVSEGFTLTDGKVFGFTVDNEKAQEITVYNSAVGFTLTVIPYTRIFTSAEELSMFYMGDFETAYNGYYILGNDIDASAYVHADHIRFAGNSYKAYTNIGLMGTFDGKGHTIDGITIGRSGLFGMVGKGAVIKNVALTNVQFSGENEGDYALACYICSATLKDVYIQAKELSTTGWNNALVANNITIDSAVENCIFRLDNAYSKNAEFGSFAAMCAEREKLPSASSRFLKDCYVISPVAMTNGKNKGVAYVCDVEGADYVYPNVKRYENVAAMTADKTNDYASFSAQFWDISSGIPVWKNVKSEPIPTYKVVFNSNGGTAVAEQEVQENATAVQPEVPQKENYIFVNWLLDGEVYDFSAPVTSDIELVATWKGKTYTLSFVGAETAVDDLTVTYGEKLVGLPAVPEKAGCVGVWMLGEEIVTADMVWTYGENKTLTAVYKANCYYLFFEGGEEIIQPMEVGFGDTLTALPMPPAKTGYHASWKIGDDTITTATVWNYTESKTATVVYEAKTYFVVCDPNGGIVGNLDFEIAYGQACNLEVPTAPDAFASFVGWTYQGELINAQTWNIDAENITIKAQWTYALSFENGIPAGFTGTLRNTSVSQSNAQASDGSYSMLLHTTSSNGYGYTCISKDYLDKVFADENVVAIAIDVYSNKTFTDFCYRGFRPTGEANITYAGKAGLTANTWKTVYYGRTAYEESANITGTNYLFYYAPSAAGLDLYVDNLHPVTADELVISFNEGGKVDGEIYSLNGETKVTVSGGVTGLMVYSGDSMDGDNKSLRYKFWRRNPGGDIILPIEQMLLGAGAYSYVAFDIKVSYDVSGALYYTNNTGTGTYEDIKAGEWTTLYCPINYYDLTLMDRTYIFRLPACADYDDFFVFIDNIRFVDGIPA